MCLAAITRLMFCRPRDVDDVASGRCRQGDPMLSSVTLEFSGGCELLVGKQHQIKLINKVPMNTSLNALVLYIREHVITERPDHFINATGDGLRPGILALVNDVDAEVMGGASYVLEEGDTVAFISTLHGG